MLRAERLTPLGQGLKEAAPAFFAYTNDANTDDDIWSAIGTIALPFQLTDKSQPFGKHFYITRAHLIPAVSFNRVTGSSEAAKLEDSDSISFRAGLGWGVERNSENNDFDPFDNHSILTSIRYDTDFGGDLSSLAAELDWQPMGYIPYSINGNFSEFGSFLTYRTKLSAHLEAGEVYDNGGNEKLQEGHLLSYGA